MMQPTQDFFFLVQLLFFILLVAKHMGTDWDIVRPNKPVLGRMIVPVRLVDKHTDTQTHTHTHTQISFVLLQSVNMTYEWIVHIVTLARVFSLTLRARRDNTRN